MLDPRTIVFVVAAVVGVSLNLPAQSFPADSGSRVRVVVWTGRDSLGRHTGRTADYVGTLISARADTIRLRSIDLDTPVSIARRDVAAAYVSSGTHTNRRRDALIGTAVGLTVGAVVGYAGDWTSCDSNGCRDYDPGESGHLFGAALIGGMGGLLGAAVGLIVGSFPADDWRPISVSRSAAFIAPHGRTVRAGMRIRW